jgi:hypothetical protein
LFDRAHALLQGGDAIAAVRMWMVQGSPGKKKKPPEGGLVV